MANIPAAFAEAIRRVTNAKTQLIQLAPFFGALALNIKYKPDPTCKTAWVDGRTIGYNPAFIAGLSHERCVTTIAHEVMHPALGHPWRRDGREHKMWNIACDKVINRLLVDSSFILPENVYIAEGDEIGKTAEWIYSRMQFEQSQKQAQQQEQEQEQQQPDENEQGSGDEGDGEQDGDESGDEQGDEPGEGEGESDEQGEGDGDGEGGGAGEDDNPFGEVRDAPSGTDEEGDEAPTEQEWKETANVAAVIAKGQGALPAGAERAVRERIQPELDTRELLLKFFHEVAASDYSWTRPNRRYATTGLYLPAMKNEGMGEVAIMADTSGSMDEAALARSKGIIEDVINEVRPLAVTVVYADAQVNHVDRFEQDEELIWRARGGGGTSFVPALDYIDQNVEAACIVCLTDMDGTFPDVPPAAPCIWINLSKYDREAVAPFGETVYGDYR